MLNYYIHFSSRQVSDLASKQHQTGCEIISDYWPKAQERDVAASIWLPQCWMGCMGTSVNLDGNPFSKLAFSRPSSWAIALISCPFGALGARRSLKEIYNTCTATIDKPCWAGDVCLAVCLFSVLCDDAYRQVLAIATPTAAATMMN